MLRIIIKRKVHDVHNELKTEEFETVVIESTVLESILLGGRDDQNGYDHRQVVGVEVIEGCQHYHIREISDPEIKEGDTLICDKCGDTFLAMCDMPGKE